MQATETETAGELNETREGGWPPQRHLRTGDLFSFDDLVRFCVSQSGGCECDSALTYTHPLWSYRGTQLGGRGGGGLVAPQTMQPAGRTSPARTARYGLSTYVFARPHPITSN